MLSEVQFERPTKQLKQDLEANLGDSRVISSLGKLVTNESVCQSFS